MPARIFLFSLDELRSRFGAHVRPGADARSDTAPFRAFRARLLELAARAAIAPCELSMWWEGTYNGCALAVAVEPAGALPALDPSPACPADEERVAPARAVAYPLARAAPGRAEVARGPGGETYEAPFGAATGHFGAPGIRRVG